MLHLLTSIHEHWTNSVSKILLPAIQTTPADLIGSMTTLLTVMKKATGQHELFKNNDKENEKMSLANESRGGRWRSSVWGRIGEE